MGLSDNELRRQAKVVDDLLRHGNLPAALGLMSEWTVSWMTWRRGRMADWLDHHGGRREAANALNAMAAAADDAELRASLLDEQPDLGRFWKSLRELRNGYAHHGMRRQDLVASPDLDARLAKVHEYWNVLRARPQLTVALDEGSNARLLVSPMGLPPGVLFSALHACRSDGGFGEPTECIVVCSAETEGGIAEALRAARYEGAATPLVLSDPHGGRTEIKRLLTGARRRIFGAREMLVNVTGGTTLMGLAVEALANEGRRLACPVRRFGLIVALLSWGAGSRPGCHLLVASRMMSWLQWFNITNSPPSSRRPGDPVLSVDICLPHLVGGSPYPVDLEPWVPGVTLQ